VYGGGRAPTLNELYRPFRAGDVSTLANPALEAEFLFGGELAVRLRPDPRLEWSFRGFTNQLQNAVANLTRVNGPGNFPGWGFLPAGTSGARRENIDRAQIAGVETRLEWKWNKAWSLVGSWLGTHSQVRECRLAPDLTGKALPQMPASQIAAQLHGAHGPWHGMVGVRHVGKQFEDDSNRLSLKPFWTIDARIGRSIGGRSEIFVSGENLANAEIQTRRDPSGVIAIGMPRLWATGIRIEF
jgi:outer membrane receptor protein involved in Fe transport